MKKNLEKYLKENRLRLDVEKPDDDSVWEGIRGGMQNKRQTSANWFWKVAAIFILIVSGTYFVVNETNDEAPVKITLADISDDLGKQEAELKQLVNLKWEEIEPQIPEQNSDIQFLLNEMKELDKVYETYQNDLGNLDANEAIISALLDYYQKKIRILNRLLHEIQKQENHETITL